MSNVLLGEDGKIRCSWCYSAPEFLDYHDKEWGVPVRDDFKLFEKICLEGFQAGLSWRTILIKRENFRKVFHNFNFNKIAKFSQKDVNRLLKDEGIIRHRGKIEAVINNAKCAQKIIEEEGTLASFIWKYKPDSELLGRPQTASTSPASVALSKELKQRGWKFVGPTTVYAFMQAMGLINDHGHGCFVRDKIKNR